MRIGFIGLGRMGGPMVRRLLEHRFEVRVFSRSPRRIAAAVACGAHGSNSALEAAYDADVVLLALPNPNTVEIVCTDLATSARRGQIYIDHSTVGLQTSQYCHAVFSAHDATFLDAAVSGGPRAVRRGSLTIMVGGDAGALDAVRRLLLSYSDNICYCGGAGAGTAVKLVNQVLVAIYSVASAEAALLARALNVNVPTLASVLRTSSGASPIALRRFAESTDSEVGAPLHLLAKDQSIVLETASQLGLDLRLTSVAAEMVRVLIDRGGGDLDISVFDLEIVP